MATEKNITMKQFNGTDYDTLYPKTIASQIPDVYSKTEVLTTETLSKYGLTADKLPNDVFQQIKTLIDNVQASADGKARIQIGSYDGTGTYGSGNRCSLTFNFVPKVLIIQQLTYGRTNTGAYSSYYLNTNAIMIRDCGFGLGGISSNSYSKTYVYWNDTTVTWYNDTGDDYNAMGSAEAQLNKRSDTYYYFAIG